MKQQQTADRIHIKNNKFRTWLGQIDKLFHCQREITKRKQQQYTDKKNQPTTIENVQNCKRDREREKAKENDWTEKASAFYFVKPNSLILITVSK